MISRRAKEEKELGVQERMSLAITRFTGSMPFAYLHVAVFGLWIAVNKGWLPLVQAWDPSLVVLAMAASVEAIFITTFVLISQNRMAEEDGKRADLALQIALLNEHETTKLVEITSAIAAVVGARPDVSTEDVEEMKKSVSPEAVLEEIERQKTQT
ncbi:DUF1003 domain-containing protein [Rhizobium herbae]|uniref:DUF1003 domain-containing protein n=1 Tax=Rhizobium herbae TaxID=508661 RepID=A0ABS7HBA8_9HYPH|nr:DUF1003 domain-containing protein [Rhizobium herbae]MBW9064369.1 DUF1003 domain-containing protein [Rhizobium herbae]